MLKMVSELLFCFPVYSINYIWYCFIFKIKMKLNNDTPKELQHIADDIHLRYQERKEAGNLLKNKQYIINKGKRTQIKYEDREIFDNEKDKRIYNWRFVEGRLNMSGIGNCTFNAVFLDKNMKINQSDIKMINEIGLESDINKWGIFSTIVDDELFDKSKLNPK